MFHFKKRLASSVLRGLRFRLEGTPPVLDKYVYLAAPHTSNWDGLFMMLFAYSMDLRVSWMVKREVVRFPFRRMLLRMGAIPIDRSGANDTVGQVVEAFKNSDTLVVVIPPEGTRAHREYWKSGFYHVARGANVPVVLGFLDYERRVGGFGPVIHLTGEPSHDMDRIREFYQGLVGRHPERQSRIRLRLEDEIASGPTPTL